MRSELRSISDGRCTSAARRIGQQRGR